MPKITTTKATMLQMSGLRDFFRGAIGWIGRMRRRLMGFLSFWVL